MEFKDYYKILGVEADADKADIKSAYRKLARKYHPDLNPGQEAEDKFKEVAEAWEVLGNDQRRAEFDELRSYGAGDPGGFQMPPGWQASHGEGAAHFSGDFSEFFNEIFGAQFDRGEFGAGGGRGHGPLRGQDIEIEMPVFLEETLEDTVKPVQFEIPGSGRRSLKVTIPAGVAEGERIRVRGQGVPGAADASPGDLYLHIRLVPHPLFDVEGRDLVLTMPVAPWEAALGASIEVPTLDGRIKLNLAAGSQSGSRLRVKGRGLAGKQGRGDLYVLLRVVMPTVGSSQTDQLWRDLADATDFDPRADWGELK